MVARDTDPVVRKKAALCLLKLFRTNPDNIMHADWAPQMVGGWSGGTSSHRGVPKRFVPSMVTVRQGLMANGWWYQSITMQAHILEDRHLGVILSAMSLLIALASKSPTDYEICVPYVIHLLSRLVLQPRPCSEDYLYYNTPCPWLQVKFFKFLQLYPPPTDPDPSERLNDSLKKVLTATAVSDTVNKSNADHSVLFEAVNVILSQGPAADPRLKTQVSPVSFLQVTFISALF